MIEFACATCGKKLKAPDNYAGKRAKCKGCGQVVQVPDSLDAFDEPEEDDSAVASDLLRNALDRSALQEAPVAAAVKMVACESCGRVVNEGTPRCPQCHHAVGQPVRRASVVQEPSRAQSASTVSADASELSRAIIGACLGGGLGGGIWAAVCYFTEYEIGWIAWGVGALAGFGATAASGATGGGIAIIAVLGALLGLIIGKVGTVMAFGADVEAVGEIIGPYDILWVILAIGTAAKMGAGGGGDDSSE